MMLYAALRDGHGIMSDTYTTKQAAEITGASRQALRAYTRRYARYFSTEATPEQGQDRRYTRDDLRLVAYIYSQTSAGASHDQVNDRLAAGALDAFEWHPPESGEEIDPAPDDNTALVPVAQLQAAHALLQDAQRREAAAADRADELQAEIARLTLELGQAQGEAAALKSSRHRAPKWWRAIFGGSGEE